MGLSKSSRFHFTHLRFPATTYCHHFVLQHTNTSNNGSRPRWTRRWRYGHGSNLFYAHAVVCTNLKHPYPCTDCPRRNTQIEDTCIVFRQWHISSHFIFVLSFIAIILISLGYEYLRAYQRSVDRRIAQALSRGKGRDRSAVSGRSSPELHSSDVEDAGLLSGRRKKLSYWYVLSLATKTFA